jgi:hypothetical protein
MRIWLGVLALLALLAAAGCSDYRLLRDHYMGRDVLEPELTPKPPARDSRGNPILTPERR